MRVFMMVALFVVSGCFSYSTQQYESMGDEEPPRVTHSSTSVGLMPGPSPVETAMADAIGTGAKTDYQNPYRGYGGYGGYGGVGAVYGGYGMPYRMGAVGLFNAYPGGAPPNRVLKFENHTGMWVRLAMSGQSVGGFIPPDETVYITSANARAFDFVVCGYEAPGGAYMGKGRKKFASRMDQPTHYRARNWLLHLTGPCPF